MGPAGPVYELTLDIDRQIIEDLDAWLLKQIEALRGLPGFAAARILVDDEGGRERVRRIVRCCLDDEASLVACQAGPAATLRAASGERFGALVDTTERVLRTRTDLSAPRPACLNCAAPLTGQYCGQCGQRARDRLISILELLRDAAGDLLEIDSRLWRTLIPLAIRPGQLTVEYLRGRRARFMPPFRTYLVLSLLFFVIAFFDPQHDFGLLLEPDPTPAAGTPGIVEPAASVPDNPVPVDCNLFVTEDDDMPAWLARRLTPERVEQLCERIRVGGPAVIIDRLVENLPIGLYILLPLIALVLKVLYPLSRRYYVEHLLFVVHFHAFVFLALILQLPVARAAANLPEGAASVLSLLIPFYIPVYLYRALRRVYGQGHLLTLPKYVLLLTAYAVISGTLLAIAALLAALSI